jgi:aspartate-semialdehyde dehydrogenase
MKMVWETQKILEDDTIMVNPTCVRIPVFYGHSEAIHLETREPITSEQATALLASAPGVEVVDTRVDGGYPTPITEGAGGDAFMSGVSAPISVTPRGSIYGWSRITFERARR